MDKKDLRLLEALDGDPRMPITALAKKIAVSPQVAAYRLNRLFEQGVLQKTAAVINLSKLGYEQYRIFFRFKNVSEAKKDEVFNYLAKHKNIYWVAKIGGQYDLLCVVFVKTFQDYDEFLSNLHQTFPKVLQDYHAFYGVHHEYYSHKHWSKKNRTLVCGLSKVSQKMYELDKLDRNILKVLAEDCRISSFNLGNKLGVTYKTIQNRTKKLEKQGIIEGYRIIIEDKEHPPFIVLFSYDNFDKKKETLLFHELRENKNVTQSIKLFGEWNLFLIVRTGSLEELQRLIIDLRDRYDIITEHQTIPIFKDVSIKLLPIN